MAEFYLESPIVSRKIIRMVPNWSSAAWMSSRSGERMRRRVLVIATRDH